MLDSLDAGNISAVRDHTSEIIEDAFDSTEPALIEAPPSSGKTTSTYDLAIESETPVTYLCARTDLYNEAEDHFEQEAGVRNHFEETAAAGAGTDTTFARIPSPHRDCDTFDEDEPGDEEKIKKLYAKGYSGRELHYLDADTIATPCGANCDYIEKLDEIDKAVESIDILIGHHKHAYSGCYVRDRIVVLDEFNADAFLTGYPDPSTETTDDPRKTIPAFLDSVAEIDSSFPTETFSDITDILVKRNTHEDAAAAKDWFKSRGVSRGEAEEYEFLSESLFPHDNTHLLAPLFTFSLFCMQPVGNKIELAPHSDADIREMWETAGLNPSTRVVRDRNTGEMNVFRPPDLSQAQQVIGLDGLPTPALWNLFLPLEESFALQQVLEKEDLMRYISEGLNMSLTQIGKGMHHYAGGRISPYDEDRLRAITAIEDAKPSLISSKKALGVYSNYDVLEKYVKEINEQENDGDNFEYEPLMAQNFARVKSSNEFGKEDLGVVMGTPYPGDDIVRRWAGLCGNEVKVSGEGEDKTFGEFGYQVFKHLTHNQVVQAILRFGRDSSVHDHGGAQVYVSTQALPDWFETEDSLDVYADEKFLAVVKKLRAIHLQNTECIPDQFRTAKTLFEAFDDSDNVDKISERYVRKSLEKIADLDFAIVKRDQGKYSADIYRWNPATSVEVVEGKQVVSAQQTYVL